MAASDVATEADLERIGRRVDRLRRSFDEDVPRPPAAEVARTESFLLLTLSGEAYAFPVAHALEVLQVPTIVPVPGAPPAVLGIINFRGQILFVSTIHGVLGLRPGHPGPASRIIVTKGLPLSAGILVDGVEGVAEFAPGDIQNDKARPLAGEVYLDGKLVAVLDMEQLCASGSLQLSRPDPVD